MTSLLDGMARSPGPGEVVLLGGCWWMRGLVYPAVNVVGRALNLEPSTWAQQLVVQGCRYAGEAYGCDGAPIVNVGSRDHRQRIVTGVPDTRRPVRLKSLASDCAKRKLVIFCLSCLSVPSSEPVNWKTRCMTSNCSLVGYCWRYRQTSVRTPV